MSDNIKAIVDEAVAAGLNNMMTDNVALTTLATNMFGAVYNSLMDHVRNNDKYNRRLVVFMKWRPGAVKFLIDDQEGLTVWTQPEDNTVEDAEWTEAEIPADVKKSMVDTLLAAGGRFNTEMFMLTSYRALDIDIKLQKWVDEKINLIQPDITEEEMEAVMAKVAEEDKLH